MPPQCLDTSRHHTDSHRRDQPLANAASYRITHVSSKFTFRYSISVNAHLFLGLTPVLQLSYNIYIYTIQRIITFSVFVSSIRLLYLTAIPLLTVVVVQSHLVIKSCLRVVIVRPHLAVVQSRLAIVEQWQWFRHGCWHSSMSPMALNLNSTIRPPVPAADPRSTWTLGAAPSRELTSFWEPKCISSRHNYFFRLSLVFVCFIWRCHSSCWLSSSFNLTSELS